MLLEAWEEFESVYGDDASRKAVANLMPKRVKKRRRIQTQDGSDAGWEEYFDYIFPEDEATKPNLKLLAMAKAWKMAKETTNTNPEEKSSHSGSSMPGSDNPSTSFAQPSQDVDRDDSSESSGDDSEEEEN